MSVRLVTRRVAQVVCSRRAARFWLLVSIWDRNDLSKGVPFRRAIAWGFRYRCEQPGVGDDSIARASHDQTPALPHFGIFWYRLSGRERLGTAVRGWMVSARLTPLFPSGCLVRT
jgi:hypothetical protein